MKPRIFVAIPNLGHIRTELALTLLHWVTSGKYALKIFMPMYIQPHHRARNVCLREFLREEHDYLLFVDADCAAEPWALDRLLGHGVDVVSGLVYTWKDGAPIPVAFRWDDAQGGYVPHYGQGLTPVDATTLAFTLIARRVCEDLPLGVFRWDDFPDGTTGYGEDFVFCREVKRRGYGIFCDYGIPVAHRKELELNEVVKFAMEVRACPT